MEPQDRVKHLHAGARAALQRFQTQGDPADLDVVIVAILADFAPRRAAVPPASLPGSTHLMDDLGFDSLAVTEMVFFTEDLFDISISNQEIIQVRTLDDLRGFILGKLAARAPR
jgi:acyl carrier protein